MKITVYSSKWWVGKTPIATNIALDRGYAIATNETYHAFDGFIPENRLISVDMNTAFPSFWSEVDIVFDLAWAISKTALSITSAILQSDIVLVPICNEAKAMRSGLNTINEVSRFNSNIVVIATKLGSNGHYDDDIGHISNAVHHNVGKNIPVLPLKQSTAFDAIFEHEKSIRALMQSSPLLAHHYRKVSAQFDAIYSLIDQYHA